MEAKEYIDAVTRMHFFFCHAPDYECQDECPLNLIAGCKNAQCLMYHIACDDYEEVHAAIEEWAKKRKTDKTCRELFLEKFDDDVPLKTNGVLTEAIFTDHCPREFFNGAAVMCRTSIPFRCEECWDQVAPIKYQKWNIT